MPDPPSVLIPNLSISIPVLKAPVKSPLYEESQKGRPAASLYAFPDSEATLEVVVLLIVVLVVLIVLLVIVLVVVLAVLAVLIVVIAVVAVVELVIIVVLVIVGHNISLLLVVSYRSSMSECLSKYACDIWNFLTIIPVSSASPETV